MRITDLLKPEAVAIGASASTRDEVIDQLVALHGGAWVTAGIGRPLAARRLPRRLHRRLPDPVPLEEAPEVRVTLAATQPSQVTQRRRSHPAVGSRLSSRPVALPSPQAPGLDPSWQKFFAQRNFCEKG